MHRSSCAQNLRRANMPDFPEWIEHADECKGQHDRNSPYHHEPDGDSFQQSSKQECETQPNKATSNTQDERMHQKQSYGLPRSPAKHIQDGELLALGTDQRAKSE